METRVGEHLVSKGRQICARLDVISTRPKKRIPKLLVCGREARDHTEIHRLCRKVKAHSRELGLGSLRVGEMVQQLAAHSEDLSSAPSPFVRQLPATCSTSSRGSSALFWPPQVSVYTWHILSLTHTNFKRKKKKRKVCKNQKSGKGNKDQFLMVVRVS